MRVPADTFAVLAEPTRRRILDELCVSESIYRVEAPPFERLAEWLEPYRGLWARHLDALERHLDSQADLPANSQEQR